MGPGQRCGSPSATTSRPPLSTTLSPRKVSNSPETRHRWTSGSPGTSWRTLARSRWGKSLRFSRFFPVRMLRSSRTISCPEWARTLKSRSFAMPPTPCCAPASPATRRSGSVCWDCPATGRSRLPWPRKWSSSSPNGPQRAPGCGHRCCSARSLRRPMTWWPPCVRISVGAWAGSLRAARHPPTTGGSSNSSLLKSFRT